MLGHPMLSAIIVIVSSAFTCKSDVLVTSEKCIPKCGSSTLCRDFACWKWCAVHELRSWRSSKITRVEWCKTFINKNPYLKTRILHCKNTLRVSSTFLEVEKIKSENSILFLFFLSSPSCINKILYRVYANAPHIKWFLYYQRIFFVCTKALTSVQTRCLNVIVVYVGVLNSRPIVPIHRVNSILLHWVKVIYEPSLVKLFFVMMFGSLI